MRANSPFVFDDSGNPFLWNRRSSSPAPVDIPAKWAAKVFDFDRLYVPPAVTGMRDAGNTVDPIEGANVGRITDFSGGKHLGNVGKSTPVVLTVGGYRTAHFTSDIMSAASYNFVQSAGYGIILVSKFAATPISGSNLLVIDSGANQPKIGMSGTTDILTTVHSGNNITRPYYSTGPTVLGLWCEGSSTGTGKLVVNGSESTVTPGFVTDLFGDWSTLAYGGGTGTSFHDNNLFVLGIKAAQSYAAFTALIAEARTDWGAT